MEEARALATVVEFAVTRVPWYRDVFARLGLTAEFELRIVTAGGLPPGFSAHVERAFALAVGPQAPRLAVREVAAIPSNADKFEEFVSEYTFLV